METLRMHLKSNFGVERLCALTDGVYAIVLTLLVLDLKPPESTRLTNPQLRDDLVAQIPNFAAYIISFVVVGFFWTQHHRLFASLKKCDHKVVIGNFVHLLLISLTPFTASLIGHYEIDRIAVVLFSLLLGMASLTGVTVARYCLRHDDWLDSDSPGVWVTLPVWTLYSGAIIAVISIGLSFVSREAAIALWLLLPLRDIAITNRP